MQSSCKSYKIRLINYQKHTNLFLYSSYDKLIIDLDKIKIKFCA